MLQDNRRRHRTLILTCHDIKRLVDMPRAIRIVELAFSAHGMGSVQMPAKIYLRPGRFNGDFRAMPAYIDGTEACGVKWVNVHPGNRMIGLPAVMAIIVLNSPKTGAPLAVMDGTYITNLRTGASGAVAAKYLARKGSSRIGFVGCGTQALFQLSALSSVFGLKRLDAFDLDASSAKRFVASASRAGIRARVCGAIKDCVADKDIVVTTTPSRKPIIKAGWIGPGTHINAIGADADGKEELDPKLLKRSRIVVDDMTQAVHSGEINVPIANGSLRTDDIYATLGQIINGARIARMARSVNDSEKVISIFDSTGLAVQDIAVASYVYKKALSKRTGFRRISFI